MKLDDYLSREEREHFRQASDAVALWQVFVNYALIVAAFALFIRWPNPGTFLVSSLVLAGRFVGLGILNHDAAHNALFKTKSLNRAVGRWLFAGPTLVDYDAYRKGHLSHHRNAGTLNDPDLPFVNSYPVERASMRRKLTRDHIGRTGLRDGLYLVAMSVMKRRLPSLVAHLALLGVLYAVGAPWAYGLWWAAFVLFVPVCLRIRVMGEHGNVKNLLSRDAREHARTTHAGFWARLMISPNYVNYHCEHHFFANVPGHKLPELHRTLRARGFYDDYPEALAPNYLSVLKRCVGDRDDRPDFGAVAKSKASLANMV